jgi:hypothetical protein
VHPADRAVGLDRPIAEGQLPGQVEQLGGAAAQPEAREGGWRRGVGLWPAGQSFFRR